MKVGVQFGIARSARLTAPLATLFIVALWGLVLVWPTFAGAAGAGAAAGSDAARSRSDQRQSGKAFLSDDLRRQQEDPAASPVGLWLERGQAAWGQADDAKACAACHGALRPGQTLATAAARYPRLDPQSNRLINLEDQIHACRNRSGRAHAQPEDEEVLALSAWLHAQARDRPIDVQPPTEDKARAAWAEALERGAQAYGQRMGRMNLACVHCHDQRVGRQLRAEVISPGHPTGFPVYRLRWQTLGSLERRLRACFSGVQAEVPAPGDILLRDLELFLKVRAQGMPVEGPSVRR